jgi:putative NADPH-quinone reductase
MSKTHASTPSRILVIQWHPDASANHFCSALADTYIKGAHETGHEVTLLVVSKLEFPLLHSKEEWENDEPSKDIRKAQSDIERADHIVIFYPLWLGSMPALGRKGA